MSVHDESDTLATRARALNEALDALDQRDRASAQLGHDLEAAGRRLAEEIARRQALEARVAELEAHLVRRPTELAAELGTRAAVESLLRHAGSDLRGAVIVMASVLWRRLPEELRSRAGAVRRRLGHGHG